MENTTLSFVRWLHAQKNSDIDRSMPYARIYQWGKTIQELLGVDGKFDGERVAMELARGGASAEDLASLASAEAAWRVDSLIDGAEEEGVSLEMPPETESEIIQALGHDESVILCGYRNHRGEGCTDAAIAGAGRCGKHGGSITDPEVRRSFLLVAYAKVFDGARVAVETLLDVAENGHSDMARVQAAKELLDRAGVAQDQHVHIHRPDETTSEDDVLADLRRRLNVASDRLRIQVLPAAKEDEIPLTHAPMLTAAPVSHSDDEIVDAEVVE